MTDVKLSPDKTWIPIGVALGGIITVFGVGLWVNNSFKDLAYSNKELASSVRRVEETLDRIHDVSVKRQEMQQWLEVLKARNPGTSVPDFPR